MKNRAVRAAMGALALLSLAVCLMAALFSFLGKIPESSYKLIFLIASVGWFVLATGAKPGGTDGGAAG